MGRTLPDPAMIATRPLRPHTQQFVTRGKRPEGMCEAKAAQAECATEVLQITTARKCRRMWMGTVVEEIDCVQGSCVLRCKRRPGEPRNYLPCHQHVALTSRTSPFRQVERL